MKPASESPERKLFSMAAMTLMVLFFGGAATAALPPLGVMTAEAASADNPDDRGNPSRTIRFDVALDCRTWRTNGGISADAVGRGDGFIADGRIFPADTLLSGVQTNDPNDAGSIGTWVQRGTMAATIAEIVAGARPAFFATWYHFLNDGSSLVVEGPHPESGPMAVVGGTGRFRGASGELSDEIIGWNTTGCPNLRLTIRLVKNGPK